LQDDAPQRLFAGLPRLLFVVSVLSWLFRTRLVYFGVGCDPLERRSARWLLRLAVASRRVWVRDVESQRRCSKYLGVQAQLAADVSLLFVDRLRADAVSRSRAGGGRLLIALNNADARQLTPDILSSYRSLFDSIIFVPMYQGDAYGDWSSLPAESLAQFDEVTNGLAWEDLANIFAGAQVVLASRMHAMYVSAMVGVPTAALGGAAKVDSFIDEFEITRLAGLVGWHGEAQAAKVSSVEDARHRVEEQLNAAMAYLRRD
jgi:polysaccharide pyruvyl transferase WcaK-like protein